MTALRTRSPPGPAARHLGSPFLTVSGGASRAPLTVEPATRPRRPSLPQPVGHKREPIRTVSELDELAQIELNAAIARRGLAAREKSGRRSSPPGAYQT